MERTATPTWQDLEEWTDDGIAFAVDGCGPIEPDGECEHGAPSWLIELGYI